MTTLVPIDGSQSSLDAARYAARRRPEGGLLLLYVAPSGKDGDLQRGRVLLEDARRACEEAASGVPVEMRLEIGDRQAKLPEVAAEATCDLIVMGAHGVNALPHVDRVGQDAEELSEGLRRPVVLVLPTGLGIRRPEGANEVSDAADGAEVATGNAA